MLKTLLPPCKTLVLAWGFLLSPLIIAAPLDRHEIKQWVEEHGLHLNRTWLRLMHYRKSWLGGYQSQADGEWFFLDPKGPSNPLAELVSTIEAFSSEQERAVWGDDFKHLHPQCQFPARREWLKAQGLFERFATLQEKPCPPVEAYLRGLDAESVSLVFSSFYLNNPSSTFGHTLLRVHRRRFLGRNTEGSLELLDHGINFGATIPPGTDPFTYFLGGLSGFFRGEFTNIPYYYKIREYSEYNARDLWSYKLNLSPQEINFLLLHLWELGFTHFNYKFFTENCSYHMLAVIDVAKPELELEEKIPFYIIPSETIRALHLSPNLIADIKYRPSIRKLFEERYKALSVSEKKVFLALLNKQDLRPLHNLETNESKAKVLDTLIDHFDFENPEELRKDDTQPTNPQKMALLKARAQIPVQSSDLVVETPLSQAPHLTRPSRRVKAATGWQSQRGGYAEAGYRFALFNLLDPSQGYPSNAEIEFTELNFRAYPLQRRIQLENLNVVKVTTLSDFKLYGFKSAWDFWSGIARIKDPNCEDCLGGGLSGSWGTGFLLSEKIALRSHFFVHGELIYSNKFTKSPVRAGLGPKLLLHSRPSPQWATLFEATSLGYWSAAHPFATQLKAAVQFNFSQHWSLGAQASTSFKTHEAGLNLFYY